MISTGTDEEATNLIPRGAVIRSSNPQKKKQQQQQQLDDTDGTHQQHSNSDKRAMMQMEEEDASSHNRNNPHHEKLKIIKGTASIPSQVFNLMKTILGSGALGLPAGIAHAFGDDTSAAPATAALSLIFMFALLSAFSFSTIGLLCQQTTARTYRQVWSLVVGESTSWIPAMSCMLYTACSVLCYSMVLADTIPAVWEASVGTSISRLQALLGVTTTTVLPLCLLKDLNKLTPMSIAGTVAMIYTALAMMYRCYYWTDAAPQRHHLLNQQESQNWMHADGAPPQPIAGGVSHFTTTRVGWQAALFSPNIAVFVSMLSLAFMAHFNAPLFYWGLQNNTMKRFNGVVVWGYLGAFFITAAIALAGFLTFGAASQGNILNNYSSQDSLMTISRLAIIVSVVSTYPLTLVGVRDGIFDLGNIPASQHNQLFVPLTVLLLAMITWLAAILHDIHTVFALTGATLGTAIIYLYPSIMLLRSPRTEHAWKRFWLAILLGFIGLILMVVGTDQALRMS